MTKRYHADVLKREQMKILKTCRRRNSAPSQTKTQPTEQLVKSFSVSARALMLGGLSGRLSPALCVGQRIGTGRSAQKGNVMSR